MIMVISALFISANIRNPQLRTENVFPPVDAFIV